MAKSMIELIAGDLEEKKAYRQFMKRVNSLPKDYRFAFKKIQHYMYHFGATGCNMDMYIDLVDMFEINAADGKEVLDVIGSDVAAFCTELIHASSTHTTTTREKLNEEILKHFYGEENSHD